MFGPHISEEGQYVDTQLRGRPQNGARSLLMTRVNFWYPICGAVWLAAVAQAVFLFYQKEVGKEFW